MKRILRRERTSEEKRIDAKVKSGLMRLGENPSVTLTGKSSEVAEPHQTTNPFPHVLFWDRLGRKGQKCRVITPRQNASSVQVQFEDGFIAVVNRRSIRRSD